ncbi:hypothetical protein PO909_025447, partial [Leuciscus waleckii]
LLKCFKGSRAQVVGEQAQGFLEQTQWQPDCPAHVLPLLLQGCGDQGGRHQGLPHPLAQRCPH